VHERVAVFSAKFPGRPTSRFLVTAYDMTPSRNREVESIINRYYDPATNQFLSVDPAVAQTNEPYNFTNDDPLNADDPLGLSWWNPMSWTKKDWVVFGGIVLGVIGAATGVGAVIELAAGATDLAVDGSNCSRKDRVTCAGAALGFVDVVTGTGALASGASALSLSLTAFSANLGVATSVYDVTIIVVNSKTRTSRKETIKVTIKTKAPMLRGQ
jgi:hypothetical protein